MSPLPSTKVIPAGWSQHHATAAAGGMNAHVTVASQDGPAVYDPATDDTSTSWVDHYDGPARIQQIRAAEPKLGADQVIYGHPYLVQLDYTASAAAELAPRMRVKVTAALNDKPLVGQDLWVVDVQHGSERFTRDLVCSDNLSDAPSD